MKGIMDFSCGCICEVTINFTAGLALKGIKVLEMAGLAPVPFAGMVLSDFGADVVRVDRNGPVAIPDVLARSVILKAIVCIHGNCSVCSHSGKRSVAVDVKNPLGVEAVAKLASAADILIEPYRPGVYCVNCMHTFCLHVALFCCRRHGETWPWPRGSLQTKPTPDLCPFDWVRKCFVCTVCALLCCIFPVISGLVKLVRLQRQQAMTSTMSPCRACSLYALLVVVLVDMQA